MNEPAEPIEPLPAGENTRKIPEAYFVLALYAVVILTFLAFMLPLGHPKAAKNSCIANLKQIDGAIQQWALENNKKDTNVVDLAEAMKYLKGGILPSCPAGGIYSAGATVADSPVCSLAVKIPEGHRLP